MAAVDSTKKKLSIFDKNLFTDEINFNCKQTRLEILTLVFHSVEVQDDGNLVSNSPFLLLIQFNSIMFYFKNP